MKKVSIIMSTYKTDLKILNEAIESILNQTYKNIELIIVCDGDVNEYNRLKKIEDSRVKVILNEKNKGLPYSLNLAIEKSTGEYIARMDSDDIATNDRIEKQVIFMEQHKNIGACGTDAMLFGDKNKKKKLYLNSTEQIKIQLLFRAVFIHPTIMARRAVFNKFKYNEKFRCAQDFELWSRIIEEYDMAIIPIIGLKYRVHKEQASIERKEEQARLSMETIKNNSKKITGAYDDKICETLYVLGGRKIISKENCKEISKNIDYIIERNTKSQRYSQKDLKKVLYNRFFELVVKNKIFLLNFSIIKKCFRIYNIKEIIEVSRK